MSGMISKIKVTGYLMYLLIVILIVPEILLRALGFHGENDKREFIRYDEKLGWSLIPNKDATDTGFEWSIKYHINEDGIREKSNIGNKAKDRYRILILGDSFTEGYGIHQDKRFSYLTETICNRSGRKRVEIINAGIRGYNLTQYYILLQQLNPKYKPDLVIIAATSGDLDVVNNKMLMDADVVYQYYKPYYNLENGGLALKGIPPPMPDISLLRNDKLEFLKTLPRKHSALYNFLRIISDNNAFLKKTGVLLRLKKNTSKYLELENDEYSGEAMRANKEINEEVSSAIIKEIVNMLGSGGSRLLVFLVADDRYGTDTSFYRKLNTKLGFFYGDFSELCEEYRRDKKKYCFRFDKHFNEKGNALIAKTLADFLEKIF